MNVFTQIHARVFHSTTAATELAKQNPKKNLEFASHLITAKNTSNDKALGKALDAFEPVRMNISDAKEIHKIARGIHGDSPAATKGPAQLLKTYVNHKNALEEVNVLKQKKNKYDSLSTEVIKAYDQYLIAQAKKVSA